MQGQGSADEKDEISLEIDSKLYEEALRLAEKHGTTIEQMVNRFLCWTLEQEVEYLRRWLSLSEDMAGCIVDDVGAATKTHFVV